jgi:hypothetical protein
VCSFFFPGITSNDAWLEHLLNEISTILNGHGYRAPGAPELEAKTPTTEKDVPLTTKSHLHQVATTNVNPALIRLALVTLQTFNWNG